MWVATADLPQSAGHPFYARLNRVLDDAGFDTFVETLCAKFYAEGLGRPSVTPGRYFRLLLLGYVEGLDSERAIAWRAADSLSIRDFLDFDLHEAPPDHSTLSRTRRLIDVETHQAVFTWVLQRLAEANLVHGHTIGIDATTLPFLLPRPVEPGQLGARRPWRCRTPRRAGSARPRTPRPCPGARCSASPRWLRANDDWTHPHDPDAKITKVEGDHLSGGVGGAPARGPGAGVDAPRQQHQVAVLYGSSLSAPGSDFWVAEPRCSHLIPDTPVGTDRLCAEHNTGAGSRASHFSTRGFCP